MRQTYVSLILVGLLLLSLLVYTRVPRPFISLAHGGDPALSVWASMPPTIDGVIDEEWASAASVAYTSTGGVDGVFYVMNDVVNLYIAVVTSDFEMIPIIDDRIYVYFDNDHDGVGPEAGDDIVGWHELEFFKDCFSDGSYVLNMDTDFGGTSDGAGVATNNGTHNHFEIMHPLNTVDNSHDFSLFMGDTIGFAVRHNVDGVDKGWWPSLDPAEWQDLTIFTPTLSAWASTTPLIDGMLRPAVDLVGLPAEWEDAAKMEFTLSWGAGPEVHEAAICAMNDYINLYLAFEIHSEDFSGSDKVVFNFDNDNDGFKESRDDHLFVEGINFFHDWFFAGPSQSDSDWGGTLDGVGACKFTEQPSTINGSYGFEIAHPLNTSDGFDFNLTIGDIVGFNVLFLDDGGVIGDGWPTFTQEDWTQMADIVIAAPLFRPDPNMNLKIRKIEVTQAIQWLDDFGVVPHAGLDNGVPLVKEKFTVVRVYVDVVTLAMQVHGVSVYLYATDGASGISLVEPHLWGSNGPLDEVFTARVVVDRGRKIHTANFLLPSYWVDRLSLTLVAFVKASDSQVETDYTDNWMSREIFTFMVTKPLTIGYYLIDYRPRAPDENLFIAGVRTETGHLVLAKTYPIPDLNYIPMGIEPWDLDLGTRNNRNAENEIALIEHLSAIHEAGLLDGADMPDKFYGWIPYINSTEWYGGRGGGDGSIAPIGSEMWTETGAQDIFVHEFGHSYGLNHTFDECCSPWAGELVIENWTQTYGYDTWSDIVRVPSNAEIMSYGGNRWISPYTWNHLALRLDPPVAGFCQSLHNEIQSSTSGLWVSGGIHKNNTGSLNPVFETGLFLDRPIPTGLYTVELRGAPPTEPLLYSQSFDVSFEDALDEDPYGGDCTPSNVSWFSLSLPSISGVYSVSLWNGTILLDEIIVSSHAPEATVTFPNGGETVGDMFTAAWSASDTDGNPLTFNLYYSHDYGVSWRPISAHRNGTNYRVDTSVLPGGSQSLIRVVVSDGFHTSEDQSDAVFNVPLKGPMNLVGNTVGPPEDPICFGEPVVLKGSAFDPEDGMLNGTALTWVSDINGTLGTGRMLAVTDLVPGIHNITLTATDSHGNNATHSFSITVELHSIALVDLTPEKTVVGQGFPLDLNAIILNQGSVQETFNVTAYANVTSIDVKEITLDNGTIFTVPFSWNTTGIAYGNYTLIAVADQISGEIYTADNILIDGIVLLTFPGDVNGDLKVRVDDILAISLAFGLNLGDPDYDPNLDVNCDDKIRVDDILIAALNFGLG